MESLSIIRWVNSKPAAGTMSLPVGQFQVGDGVGHEKNRNRVDQLPIGETGSIFRRR